jgi:hypothetical protein
VNVSNGTVFRGAVMQVPSIIIKKPIGFVAPQWRTVSVKKKPSIISVNKAFFKKAYYARYRVDYKHLGSSFGVFVSMLHQDVNLSTKIAP